MLLTRDEMWFDFGGAKLDPVADRDAIAWAMNQFLYGEVTGIQIGHWLYQAPDLEAARFLSRQAVEEFQHVGNFVRILEMLGKQPEPPHFVVRYLSTGAMPDDWAEHVAMEMAIGEGLVLQAFYAMIATIDHPEIVAILERGVRQEERHVDFGEKRTMAALRERPGIRKRLLGQAMVTELAVRQLGRFMEKKLPQDHAVFRRIPAFVAHGVAMLERRIERMGLSDRPLSSFGALERASIIAQSFGEKALASLAKAPLRLVGRGQPVRLTDTYLRDPSIHDRLAASPEVDEPRPNVAARPPVGAPN
jgi:hypothetical protein